MSRPDVLACALWLQRELGAYILTADHPDLPDCAGAHAPEHPCDGQRGKHPCGRWSRDSTNSPVAIRAQMARGLRNIGIDCEKSGFVVVDDDQDGAFPAYAAEIGERIPFTFTDITRKGAHHFFLQPDGLRLGNARGALRDRGIDVRGAGGFVIAPGSVHQSGHVYRPADASAPVAPAPAWLIEALTARSEPAVPARAGHGSVHGRMRGLVQKVLTARPPVGDEPGERNDVLFWCACRAGEMVAAGEVDEASAFAALSRAAEVAGLGYGAAAATIASGMRRAAG